MRMKCCKVIRGSKMTIKSTKNGHLINDYGTHTRTYTHYYRTIPIRFSEQYSEHLSADCWKNVYTCKWYDCKQHVNLLHSHFSLLLCISDFFVALTLLPLGFTQQKFYVPHELIDNNAEIFTHNSAVTGSTSSNNHGCFGSHWEISHCRL